MKIDGTASRVIRVAIGIGALSLTAWGPHSPWGFLGLMPLLSGISGFCPVCALPGVKACKVPAR